MVNSIDSVINYLPKVIDKVNKEASLSVALNANAGATGTWETQKLNVKRSTKMTLELIEGQEGQAELPEMVAEFQRTRVVPERDAVVFSKAYANASAGTTATPATLTSSTVKAAIDLGIKTLNENEAPKAGRGLYVSCEVYDYMKNSNFFTYNLNAGEGENRLDTRVAGYDGMQVIEVPKSRFNTEVTLDASNGFTLTGTDINFLIISQGAVQVVDKITKGEIVPSSMNSDSFEDTYKYLTYYDAITFDNQTSAIYAHAKA